MHDVSMTICRGITRKLLGTVPLQPGFEGSGAGGKRAGSGGAKGSIPKDCLLLLSSMVQHPAVVTITEVVTVAGMSLQRRRANQHPVACPTARAVETGMTSSVVTPSPAIVGYSFRRACNQSSRVLQKSRLRSPKLRSRLFDFCKAPR